MKRDHLGFFISIESLGYSDKSFKKNNFRGSFFQFLEKNPLKN